MPRTSTCSVLGHQLDPIAEKNCAAPELYKCEEKMIFTRKQGGSNIIPPIRDHCHPHISWKAKNKILTPKKLPPSVPRSLSEPFERPAGASKKWSLRRRLSTSRSFPANNQTKTGKLLPPEGETVATFSWLFSVCKHTETTTGNLGPLGIETYSGFFYWFHFSIDSMQLVFLCHEATNLWFQSLQFSADVNNHDDT